MIDLDFRNLLKITTIAAMVMLTNCGKKPASTEGTDKGGNNTPGSGSVAKVNRWMHVDEPVEKALSYCNHLIMTGNYPRALYLLENLGEKYPGVTLSPEVDKNLERLRAIETKDGELSPELGNLKAGNAELLSKLQTAGDDGLVVLRRHLLENKDPELSVAIARYLAKVNDPNGAFSIYTYLKQKRCTADHAKALAPSLKVLLAKHSGTAPYDVTFLEEFLMNVTVEASEQKAAVLRDILSAWDLKKLQSTTWDQYAAQIATDKNYDKIHLMELMNILYTRHAQKNETAFNRYFSRPRYETFTNYLMRASSDPRACIKRIVKALGTTFGLPDQEALDDELALHYKLNEPTNTIYVTDARTKAIRTKLMGKIAARAIVPGLDGNCMQFKGNAILRLSKRSPLKEEKEDRNGDLKKKYRDLNVLMNGNYTFAIWVNPAKKLTASESKKSTVALITRESIPVGLNLIRKGGFCMVHPASGQKCIARTNKAVPVGRWTHLAGVVNRKRGIVEIYMNGQLVGKANFRPGTPVESMFIRPSLFLVGGVNDQRSEEWNRGGKLDTRPAPPRYLNHAFVGKVDEIRLYFRALSKVEIKQVYAIHAGLAN
jgi:hypothetical protein